MLIFCFRLQPTFITTALVKRIAVQCLAHLSEPYVNPADAEDEQDEALALQRSTVACAKRLATPLALQTYCGIITQYVPIPMASLESTPKAAAAQSESDLDDGSIDIGFGFSKEEQATVKAVLELLAHLANYQVKPPPASAFLKLMVT